MCDVLVSISFPAKVDAQMVELVVHCEVQRSVSGFTASCQHLLFRTDKLPLASLSISVILRGLLPVHIGHHQILHSELPRLLHLSPLRVERIAFVVLLARQRVSILLDTLRTGWRALNVLVQLRPSLLLLVFHRLNPLHLLFPIVNDYNHI